MHVTEMYRQCGVHRQAKRTTKMSYSSQHYLSVVLPAFVLIFLTLSTPITSFASLPLASQLVYEFPNPTWVENIAVRMNGEILVTLLTSPDVYLIDPLCQPPKATLVYTFSSTLALLGITEVEDDVFYVAGGNMSISPTLLNVPGSYAVWRIDMSPFSSEGSANVTKVTDIPGAVFFNGAATLSKADKTILVADSILGGLWKVNVQSGAYSFVLSDPTMNLVDPNVTALALGINGVKIQDSYVYYTSSGNGLVCRIPVFTNGTAMGKVEVLAALGEGRGVDDFVLDSEGRLWVTQNSENLVSWVLANGTVVVDVVGTTDQLTLAGVTACAFGRGENVEDKLYCATNGGLTGPVNGTLTEGGKVAVVDTSDVEW